MNIPSLIRRAIRFTLFLVPLALFGNILYSLTSSKETTFLSLFHFHPGWLAFAIFLSLAPWLFSIVRLRIWSRFFGVKLSFAHASEAVLGNEIAAMTTPTAVGGGYAKIGLLMFRGISPGMATSFMLIGSIEDYLFVLPFIAVCWYFWAPASLNITSTLLHFVPSAETWPALLAWSLAGLAVVALFLTIPPIRKTVAHLFEFKWWHSKFLSPICKAFGDFKSAFLLLSKGGKRILVLTSFLALVQWVMRYSIFTAIAYGFGFSPHPIEFLILQWLIFILMNIVPTPGAIGGAEVIFIYIFKGFIPEAMLPVAAGYWRFVATYLQLMIAAFILVVLEKPQFTKKKIAKSPKFPEPSSPTNTPVRVVTLK